MEVKDIIRNRRAELGLTMKQLADKIGVSEGTISRWESGEIANMKRDKIVLLAEALMISPAVIMGWADETPAQPQPAPYYLNDETREIAQAIFDNPQYKALFDASRKLSPADLQFVMDMIDRMRTDE